MAKNKTKNLYIIKLYNLNNNFILKNKTLKELVSNQGK
jgi:hypothetical protein